ncbi:hypothetical protein [Prevotella corporis]|uniref:hypothetical protein n=1 Tax=Prevotella corporis TaxID=28128 RepID=UPI00236671DA|nr:hypothetical protein [Prevotella corporis]
MKEKKPPKRNAVSVALFLDGVHFWFFFRIDIIHRNSLCSLNYCCPVKLKRA